MPTTWYGSTFERFTHPTLGFEYRAFRLCEPPIVTQIRAAGGRVSQAKELPKGYGIVKVSGLTLAQHATLAAVPGVVQFPIGFDLDEEMTNTSAAERTRWRNLAGLLGYSSEDIDAALPSTGWAGITRRDVLHFLAREYHRWTGQFDQDNAPTYEAAPIATPETTIEIIDAQVPGN